MSNDDEKKDNNVVDFMQRKVLKAAASETLPSPEQDQLSEEMQKALAERQRMVMETIVKALQAQENVSEDVARRAFLQTQQEDAQLPGFFARRFDTKDRALWGVIAIRGKEQSTPIQAPKVYTDAERLDDIFATALVLAMIESSSARMFLHAHGVNVQFFENKKPSNLIL